jgi:hypothetical protein
MLQNTTIRRLLAAGIAAGALAVIAPATSLASNGSGGGGPRPPGHSQ